MEVGSGHSTPYPHGVLSSYHPHCARVCILHMLSLFLFEGFMEKAWKVAFEEYVGLGEHILPEICMQFTSTKLSPTGRLILHLISRYAIFVFVLPVVPFCFCFY